ncbi:MAG: uroporphyrinogen decarboxylase family protein [Christensenellaceae bacterium]
MSKQDKIKRLHAALTHKEGDRVPISDFFWTGFNKNAKALWGQDNDMYRRFDLDYVVVNPNMDPIIQDFEILEDNGDDILVRTGFGANVMRRADLVMPHFDEFSIKKPEEMENFVIESAFDKRRLFRSGDDQINCLGDTIVRNIPSWNNRVDMYCEDFPVFGSVCEGYEYVWRCMGTENALYWMLLEPELFESFMKRIGDFIVELAQAQIKMSDGRLSGMYIWGDVAYVNAMLFSPEIWRRIFKPIVKRVIDVCKKAGLMVIYHGCGDARPIYEDFIEIGLDGYNPVEVKAHLDAVELKKTYGGRLAFVGNVDVRELESGDNDRIKKEVLYKLQAAQGGGWICQSDHSVSNDVAPQSYAYMVELVRDYGRFPLDMDRINKELEALK